MLFQSFASGSNGNCSILDTSHGSILFDAGISRKRVIEGITALDISSEKIKYILITHAHGDHIRGLPVLMNYLPQAKVITTPETIDELHKLKRVDPRYVQIAEKAIPIHYYDTLNFQDKFKITCFPTIHDINGSSGFSLEYLPDKFSMVYSTDTADLYPDFLDSMYDSDLIFLESNYDQKMLDNSPRPHWLKSRIRKTHLSNPQIKSFLKNIDPNRAKAVFLGHISGECNSVDTLVEMLDENQKRNFINWIISSRYEKSSLFEFSNSNIKITGGISCNTHTPQKSSLEDFF